MYVKEWWATSRATSAVGLGWPSSYKVKIEAVSLF